MNKNTNKPKLLTFDFIWRLGGLIILAWGFIFPLMQYEADGKVIHISFDLGVIMISAILSIFVGLILCTAYTVHDYKKKVDVQFDKLSYEIVEELNDNESTKN